MEPRPGTEAPAGRARDVFGKYQLLAKVASGGMAEVWLARSSSIGGFEKLVAIKRMHPRMCQSQAFVSMFIEEAKLSVALNHPNIVQIFDFGRIDDNYFIAMEYVEGVDLSTLAHRARGLGKALPVEAVLYVMREVFEGLAYAHGRRDRAGRPAGVIHRDVSPHNVLVSFDGQIKISDFGIAKAVEELKRSGSGEIVGKVAYMSPELARGEVVTTATDIWAGGVILHELLANQRLFPRETDALTLEAVAKHAIPAASSFNPAAPPEVDALLSLLLERDPARRASSARDVAEALTETLRVHFPRMNDYRLAEILLELYEGDLPRIVPSPTDTAWARPAGLDGGLPPIDSTAPAGKATLSAIRSAGSASAARRSAHPWAYAAENAPVGLGQASQVPTGEPTPPLRGVGEAIARLKSAFVSSPNLWVLYDIGETYEAAGLKSRALGAYKLAAAKFAQHGLLVQAVAISCKVLQLEGASEPAHDGIKRLRTLQGLSDAEVLIEIFDPRDETADYSEYHGIFEGTRDQKPVDVVATAPILASLGAEQFLRLVRALRLRKLRGGEPIVREGDPGESFYWIGRGRVVVSATTFEGGKIYVTSLADGDCFGEQSFFTGKRREATVEALEECLILEVSKRALDAVIAEFPGVTDTLRQFYKDRIAESHLARSPIFHRLSVKDRRMLAERFTFATFGQGQMILMEGEESSAFYAIKSGRVEVFTGADSDEVPLAILEAGEVFGEVAALKGTRRTASVRALEDCELLCLEAGELQRSLAQNAGIRMLIEAQIEARAEETIKKLVQAD